jgi:hypothetical protein
MTTRDWFDRLKELLDQDRIKRVLGEGVSDRLLGIRQAKVREAQDAVDTALGRVTDAGLVPTQLHVTQRATFEQHRVDAMALKSNDAKYTALEPVKDNFRALATRAECDADTAIAAAEDACTKAKNGIDGDFDMAAKVTHASLAAVLAPELQRAREAYQQADQTTPVESRRLALVALKAFGLSALRDLGRPLRQSQRHVSDGAAMLASMEGMLGLMSKHDEYDTWQLSHRALVTRSDDLSSIDNADTLRSTAETLFDEIMTLNKEAASAFRENSDTYTKIGERLSYLNSLIERAEATTHKAGKAILDRVALDLKSARDTANGQSLVADRLCFLVACDSKPIIKALHTVGLLDKGVPSILSALDTMIPNVDDTTARGGFIGRVDALKADYLITSNLTMLDAARDAFKTLSNRANSLMDDVVAALGDSGMGEALSARFGVTVKEEAGAKVHLKKTYEMLALVPMRHVDHDKCAKVHFEHGKVGAGSYSEAQAIITMKGFSENEQWSYLDNGSTVKVNGFNVTMLHEIGHALDDKHQIMNGVMNTKGYGGWRKETRSSTLDAYNTVTLSEMRDAGDLGVDTEAAVREALTAALKNGEKPSKIADTSNGQHNVLKKYCGWLASIRVKAKPYFNSKLGDYAIDGRVYIESYGEDFHSFDEGERTKAITVRDYQWRAPGEWFAELYGFYWLRDRPPKGNVGNEVLAWLPAA